jgi:hypothetical protein
MASGETLLIFTPLHNQPPASGAATLDLRNSHPVLDFDAAAAEDAIFGAILPRHYAGGGLTVILTWMATSATSGDVKWNAAIERDDSGTDLDADSFASAQTTTTTAPATSGAPITTSIAFTSGAQMDSLAVGEKFRLKVTRDAAAGGDTMTGDAEILAIEIKET